MQIQAEAALPSLKQMYVPKTNENEEGQLLLEGSHMSRDIDYEVNRLKGPELSLL
jgi:hypothetical protein